MDFLFAWLQRSKNFLLLVIWFDAPESMTQTGDFAFSEALNANDARWFLSSWSLSCSSSLELPYKIQIAAKIDYHSKNWRFFFFQSLLIKLCFLNPNLLLNCGKAYANPPNLVVIIARSLQLIKQFISYWNFRNFGLKFLQEGHISMANKNH